MTNKITLPSEFTEKVLLAMLSSAGWVDKQAADVVQFAQDVTTHFVGSEQETAGRNEGASVSLESEILNAVVGSEIRFLALCAHFHYVSIDKLIALVAQLVARGKLFTIVGHDNDLGNPCILSLPPNDRLTRRTVCALRELFVRELVDKTYDAVISAHNYLTMYSRAELDAAYWDAYYATTAMPTYAMANPPLPFGWNTAVYTDMTLPTATDAELRIHNNIKSAQWCDDKQYAYLLAGINETDLTILSYIDDDNYYRTFKHIKTAIPLDDAACHAILGKLTFMGLIAAADGDAYMTTGTGRAFLVAHKRAQASKVTAAPYYVDGHVVKQTAVLLDWLRTAKKRVAVVSAAWLAEYMGYNDAPFSLVLDGLVAATGTELIVHSWTDGVAVPVGQDTPVYTGMYILIDKAAL